MEKNKEEERATELPIHNNELRLHKMEVRDGGIDLSLSGEPAKLFMQTLIEFFKQNGGKNFLSLTVDDGKNKYSISIENCNGTLTSAEKMTQLERLAEGYKDLAIDLGRIIQRLERENVDLTVDDIKTIWKLKIALGISTPISVEEGTGSMIMKGDE